MTPLCLRWCSRDFCVSPAVRVVGAGCLSDISAASSGPFKSWLGLASYELQG